MIDVRKSYVKFKTKVGNIYIKPMLINYAKITCERYSAKQVRVDYEYNHGNLLCLNDDKRIKENRILDAKIKIRHFGYGENFIDPFCYLKITLPSTDSLELNIPKESLEKLNRLIPVSLKRFKIAEAKF